MAAMSLLQPTVSTAQIRADRDRALQYQQAIAQDAAQKKAEAEQVELQTQESVRALYDVPFLEQDQQRWKDLVDTILDENGKKVQKDYPGDPERYARERAKQDTQNLIARVQKDPLLKQSLKRRSDFVQLVADQGKGLIDRPVTYKLTDGTTKTAPATENYKDFVAGKTQDFIYGGGYAAPTKWRESIGKEYHPSSASDPQGKFKAVQATGGEILGRFMSDDGMKPEDAVDYATRFGNRLPPTYYKFDPRDPYKEAGIKQRDEQLRQGRDRNAMGWYSAQSGRMNAISARQNANTNAQKLKLDKAVAGQGFNAFGTTFDVRNIKSVDANNVPTTIPATVYNDGKAQATPWSMTVYDGQLIMPQVMQQIGVKEVRGPGGQVGYTGGNLKDTYVKVPNAQGGYDLRKTDLSGLKYQIVGGGDLYYRNRLPGEKTPYEKTGGPEKLYPELTLRITAEEALKGRAGKLFNNKWFFKDSETGAGAYRVVKGKDGTTYYDFPIVEGVTPTAATRVKIEGSPTGRYMDSKAGDSSLHDYENESAPMGNTMDLFDDID